MGVGMGWGWAWGWGGEGKFPTEQVKGSSLVEGIH